MRGEREGREGTGGGNGGDPCVGGGGQPFAAAGFFAHLSLACDPHLYVHRTTQWQVNIEHNGKHVKDTMTANCVRLLRTSPGQVNVKARTHEKLDSVGESRAVECHVVLTLEKQQ